MTRLEFEEQVYRRYGVRADYPFEEDFETGVFRHESGKWFALAMNISEKKIGRGGDKTVDVVNFKCAPEIVESIVGVEVGIYPAYHMNKAHWLSVALDECDEGTLSWLLGVSFGLTAGRCPIGQKGGKIIEKN